MKIINKKTVFYFSLWIIVSSYACQNHNNNSKQDLLKNNDSTKISNENSDAVRINNITYADSIRINSITPDSMFSIGYFYLTSGDHDYPDSAFFWLTQAHEHGNDMGTLFLGNSYLFGTGRSIDGEGKVSGIPKDTKKGIQLLNSLAEKNNTSALSSLGRYYLSTIEKNKGIEYLMKGVKLNDSNCMYQLGYLYYNGFLRGYSPDTIIIKKEPGKGVNLLKSSADLDYLPAVYEVAWIYSNGDDYVKKDSALAEKYIKILYAHEDDLQTELGISENDVKEMQKKIGGRVPE